MKYKRILLKLSGESIAGTSKLGIDEKLLLEYAEQIKTIVNKQIQVGIVIGGGNIFRGISGQSKGFDRVKGDQMGMLATVINSLALQSALESIDVKTKVFTSITVESIGNRFSKQEVLESFSNNYVCIFSGGTGNPYFSTDTASALRAIEIQADVFLKGTRVDGVYSADPEKDKNAIKFEKLSFDEIYAKKLKIMDLTAFTLCKENNMKVIVFNMDEYGNLEKVLNNNSIGTLITNE